MDRRPSMIVLCVGLAVVAAYPIVPSQLQAGLYQAIGFAAAMLVIMGVRQWRPSLPHAWYLLAGGIFSWFAADAVWQWYGNDVPDLSVADGLYLLGYPLITAAAVIMVRARRPGRDIEGLIDGLIIGVAGMVVAWVALVDPLLGVSSNALSQQLVTVAYPVADVAIMAVLARLITAPGAGLRASLFLAAGLGATLVGDVVYLVQLHQGTFLLGSWVDVTWLAGYVFFATAALHPSMPELTAPGRREHTELGPARLTALGVALATVSLMSSWGPRDGFGEVLLGGCAVLLVVLVLCRLAVVMAAKDQEIADRVRAEEALALRALRDPLTGLADRESFMHSVEAALAERRLDGGTVSLLFLDLDHFKVVNDTLGHQVGDDVLKVVADRLHAEVGRDEILARFGGDEFTVLSSSGADVAELEALARRLTAVAAEPVEILDRSLSMGVSIGIAVVAAGAGDAHTMLRDADTAMYRAKSRGRNTFEFFDDGLRARAMHRLDLEARLRVAVQNRELRLLYQPEIDLGTRGVFGVEALLRWEIPGQPTLSPIDFMSVAEETGLIVGMGAWVMEAACAEACRWPAAPDGSPIVVSVNLSSRQLADPHLLGTVTAALRRSGLHPSRLCIEITESALLDDPDSAIVTLGALKAMGIKIAVDDFGTGYFSLRQLKHFPIDIVKIDREFVAGLDLNAADTAIVAATLGLAHGMGMIAVAEGVETPAQVASLRSMGCDVAQGYFYARPLPADELPALIEGQRFTRPVRNQPAPSTQSAPS